MNYVRAKPMACAKQCKLIDIYRLQECLRSDIRKLEVDIDNYRFAVHLLYRYCSLSFPTQTNKLKKFPYPYQVLLVYTHLGTLAVSVLSSVAPLS